MGPLLITVIVVVVILVVAALICFGIYNKLVKLRERGDTQFSQIDVQLERRHDLIPNLVETAKGYMAHERETLESVMAARASATQARVEVHGDTTNLDAMNKLGNAEGALGGALSRLMATMEAYPDLKANTTMQNLMEELTTTENKVAFARQSYNDIVNNYRTYKKQFPAVIFASLFGFQDQAYLEADESKRDPVKVDFGV